MIANLKRVFEQRQQNNATDDVIQQILRNAVNVTANALATNAIETAAGIVGRALASAEVSGDPRDLVTPSVLFEIGRSLIRRGEYVAVETNRGLWQGRIESVAGGGDPNSWRYELAFNTPNSQVAKRVYPIDEFIFVKYIDGGIRGSAPIAAADASAQAIANITQRLAEELGSPVGYLLPIPARDGGSANVANLRNAIGQLKGRVLTVESQQSLANTAGFTRNSEWNASRLGANLPQSIAQIYKELHEQTIVLCGVPLSVVNQSAQREAWRQFIFGTIAPLGKLIVAELRKHIGNDLSLNFEELRASDITGRARAFQSLVGGGLDLNQAAQLSGLLAVDQ